MKPTLAIDIGGSKILVGLVAGAEVTAERLFETPRKASPDVWLDAVAEAVAPWSGRFAAAGVAVSGWIRNGRWSALNPATLPVPPDFPLVDALSQRLAVPVLAANDAQAAAWGEYRHGAGQGRDMVFLTISTGIGGGIVTGGRLLTGRGGIAGHVGQTWIETPSGESRLEDAASGAALARAAAAMGRPADTRALIAEANAGDPAAEQAVALVIERLARAMRSLQLVIDPDLIVIGGGLGLSDGFLGRLRAALAGVPQALRPDICAAALGANAGLIGIADLVTTKNTSASEVNP
jgi:predicted NBD/HSP70 family sugar kinase